MGGFDKEYLHDKLLTPTSGKHSEIKNKMGLVATMFGKRLNQDFKIKRLKPYFRFTKEGLALWEKEAGCYLPAPHDVFMELLRGEREIEHEEGGSR